MSQYAPVVVPVKPAPVAMAVVGAGLIGRRHIEHITAEPEAALAAIVDPAPEAKALAAKLNVPWFPDFASLIAKSKPDGVIVATPTQAHAANGLEAIAAGIPALVEKPIADDVASATRLVEAAGKARVPLLIGHHRRYNPMIARARDIIASGRLGRIVAVHASFWLMKPDDYFDIPWRRQVGAGPILTNLIHDVDLLRHLVGEVAAVQAITSNAIRGNAIEETAVILLRFANGALGTVTISDSIVAPWSWEQTTGENPAYPMTDQSCYQIGGTHGSLNLPKLDVWTNPDKRSWWEPFEVQRTYPVAQDPLRLQIRNFARVIRGTAAPLVTGRDGLETLRVIDAIQRAASSGQQVVISQ